MASFLAASAAGAAAVCSVLVGGSSPDAAGSPSLSALSLPSTPTSGPTSGPTPCADDWPMYQ
ncbi:MAG: hypothetical protein ACREOE_21440, partial [Gemmatimonadales bacterium]